MIYYLNVDPNSGERMTPFQLDSVLNSNGTAYVYILTKNVLHQISHLQYTTRKSVNRMLFTKNIY